MVKKVKNKIDEAHAGTGQLAEEQGARVLSSLVPEKEKRFVLPKENRGQSVQNLEKSVDAGIEELHELSKRGPEIKKVLDDTQILRKEKEIGPEEKKFAEQTRGHREPQFVAKNRDEVSEFFQNLIDEERKRQGQESGTGPFVSFFRRIGYTLSDTVGAFFGRIRTAFDKARDRSREVVSMEQAGETARGWVAEELGGETAERFNRTKPVVAVFDRGIRTEGDVMAGDAAALYLIGTNQIVANTYALREFGTAERLEIMAHEQFHYAAYLGGGLEGMRWRGNGGKPQFVSREDAMWLHEGITELLAQQLIHSKGYQTTKGGYPLEITAAYLIQQLAGEGLLKEAYLSGDFTKVRSVMNEKLGPASFEIMMAGKNSPECLMRLIGMIKERKADVGNPLENWLIKATGVLDGVWNARTD